MSFMERTAALRQEMREVKEKAIAEVTPRPRYRVRDGKYVIRMYAVLAKPKPASNVAQLVSKKYEALKYDRKPVQIGARCNHCANGVYTNPKTREAGKCFVCNGKGRIDARDKAFDDQRRAGRRGPVCHMRSAA